jgi:hypothetical protein
MTRSHLLNDQLTGPKKATCAIEWPVGHGMVGVRRVRLLWGHSFPRLLDPGSSRLGAFSGD